MAINPLAAQHSLPPQEEEHQEAAGLPSAASLIDHQERSSQDLLLPVSRPGRQVHMSDSPTVRHVQLPPEPEQPERRERWKEKVLRALKYRVSPSMRHCTPNKDTGLHDHPARPDAIAHLHLSRKGVGYTVHGGRVSCGRADAHAHPDLQTSGYCASRYKPGAAWWAQALSWPAMPLASNHAASATPGA